MGEQQPELPKSSGLFAVLSIILGITTLTLMVLLFPIPEFGSGLAVLVGLLGGFGTFGCWCAATIPVRNKE